MSSKELGDSAAKANTELLRMQEGFRADLAQDLAAMGIGAPDDSMWQAWGNSLVATNPGLTDDIIRSLISTAQQEQS